MNLPVLFEDNHLLIVNKSANLPTQPRSVQEETQDSLESRAKAYIKEKYQKPGDVFLHAVHRLDKEVEGIVIFAKTSKALSRMQELIREKKLEKFYHAKVHGHLMIKKRKLSHFLAKKSHHAIVSHSEDPEAKHCVLSYEVLKEDKHTSLLEIHLESGRYHQIRVQLSDLGHPIVGDAKYGSTMTYPDHHIDLKHTFVSFEHPVRKTLLEIKLQ
jgi:23S rRNA pseudouridine1911/1915/1917 synthase